MKTVFKAISLLFISNMLTPLGIAYAQEKFRVCADPLHPPYSTKQQTGYENLIAELFAKQLGQEVEYYWFPDRMGFIRNTLKAEDEKNGGYKCDVIMGLPVGTELAETTKAYLHSTYVLLILKEKAGMTFHPRHNYRFYLCQDRKSSKLPCFDRGPGTTWLQKNGLLEQGVPYQSMTGDSEHNTAMQIENDLRKGVIDMAILWGPMAAYVQSQSPLDSFIAIPMQSSPGIQFDFSIAMAVRQATKSANSY